MTQPKVNSSQLKTGSELGDLIKLEGVPGTGSPLIPGLIPGISLLGLSEDITNGTNYIAIQAPDSITTTRTWILPDDDPSTASGKFLTTDASGNLSFAVASSTYVPLTINTQSGTEYTLLLTDAGKYIRMTSASANTVILPANADVAFDVGTEIIIRQAGAGKTTIASPGSPAVTINTAGSGSPPSLSITSQHETVSLVKVATDEWDLVGALE